MSALPPRLAVWLLTRSGADAALIGDLQEIFESRPSRTWYWRQAIVALLVGERRRLRRHTPRAIRMAVTIPAAIVIAIYATACGGPAQDISGIRVETVSSGWATVAQASGETKVAPVLALTLKNVSDEALAALQLNAVFRRGDESQEWGNAFRIARGLGPGASISDIRLVSHRGYVGTEGPAGMLANSHFVDARVDLFGRFGSMRWTKLGEYRVSRTLVTP